MLSWRRRDLAERQIHCGKEGVVVLDAVVGAPLGRRLLIEAENCSASMSKRQDK
jgi:hypothetical protein